jgi:1-aminocyclopropane-1-carboxylate deaminase/D-cysteine desulfhydrase-like pyridoxal-dependent ACC family enzyme
VIALARAAPRLAAAIDRVSLGAWPTPIARIELDGGPVWVKCEGRSAERYGGNKVRTLEPWLGHALARGARRLWALGAYGSNHVVAARQHAPPGLEVGAVLFPQPHSSWAHENCGAILAGGPAAGPIWRLRSVVELPLAALVLARRDRGSIVMPPGGATPIGTFGAVAGAFELAEQIGRGDAPVPQRIVLPVGSTCTSAGLLAGLALARALGAWPWALPIVHAVRVTPWPVTAARVVVELAARTLARASRLAGYPLAATRRQLAARLALDRRELGAGYGRITPAARAVMATWPGPRLDGVYSGKAAAALIRLHRGGAGPLLLWATKSERVLAPPSRDQLASAPRALARWLSEG